MSSRVTYFTSLRVSGARRETTLGRAVCSRICPARERGRGPDLSGMQAIQYDQTVTLSFRDVNYFVHGFVDEEGDLVVEVEQKANGARWCGRFSPAGEASGAKKQKRVGKISSEGLWLIYWQEFAIDVLTRILTSMLQGFVEL
eukprot:1355200-Amorphochlora_amoeboformis.AAC.2